MQPRFMVSEINPDVLINTPPTHTHTPAPKTNERVQFFVFFCHSYTCVYRVLMHTQEGRMKNALINMLPTLQRSCHWLGF